MQDESLASIEDDDGIEGCVTVCRDAVSAFVAGSLCQTLT